MPTGRRGTGQDGAPGFHGSLSDHHDYVSDDDRQGSLFGHMADSEWQELAPAEPTEPPPGTQARDILDHLRTEGPLTALDALRSYRCLRLAARIRDLKVLGWPIVADPLTLDSGKRVARYSLVTGGAR